MITETTENSGLKTTLARIVPESMVKISAYRGDEAPYRMYRLAKLVGALIIKFEDYDPFKNILGLHDHKGQLTVIWNSEKHIAYSGYTRKVIGALWCDDKIGHEPGGDVEHITVQEAGSFYRKLHNSGGTDFQ